MLGCALQAHQSRVIVCLELVRSSTRDRKKELTVSRACDIELMRELWHAVLETSIVGNVVHGAKTHLCVQQQEPLHEGVASALSSPLATSRSATAAWDCCEDDPAPAGSLPLFCHNFSTP